VATQELETKVKALEDQVKIMGNQIKTLQTLLDIEEIKKLQRIYGSYLEHWMSQEIIDCFADGPGVFVDMYPIGIWKGKEGVIRYFDQFKAYNPEFLHQIMQIAPIIDVAADGKTAKGRWTGYGSIAGPSGKGVTETTHSGTYEMEYVKEGGKWKIRSLSWRVSFMAKAGKGFVKPERYIDFNPGSIPDGSIPDVVVKGSHTSYPSGYIYPFHYKHPVTGKKTREEKINSELGIKIGE
jgi:hypothetical protein